MTDTETKKQEPHLEDEDLFEEFALAGEPLNRLHPAAFVTRKTSDTACGPR